MKKNEPKLEVMRLKHKGGAPGKGKHALTVLKVFAVLLLLAAGAFGFIMIADQFTGNDNAAVNVQLPPSPVVTVEPAATAVPTPTPTATHTAAATTTPAPANTQKVAYLTFDDGPTNITSQVLDILKEKNVPATFFVIGNLAEKNPVLIRRMSDEGHQVANHTYTHVIEDVYASYSSLKEQIAKADEVLKDILGEAYTPGYFRFPRGSHDANAQQYVEELVSDGVRIFDWNALTGDAEGNSKTADELIVKLKETVAGKRSAFILMHDSATKQTTADGLSAIIDYLKSEGFEFRLIRDYDGQKGFY